MIYVTLASLAALVATVFAFGQIIRSLVRQQARERDLLLNQLCNLAGKPWQLAPSAEPFAAEDAAPEYDWAPEQTLDAALAE